MVGAPGNENEMDAEVAAMVAALKAAAEEKAGSTFATFVPLKYTTQVVAGTNFMVRVKTGEGECAHVKIYEPLPHTGQPPTLSSIVTGKSLDEPL